MKRTTGLVAIGLAMAALAATPLAVSAQQRPAYDYIGVGGGDNGLVLNGKATLGDNLSVRPSLATEFDFDGDTDASYLLPVTYDFNAVDAAGKLFPFVGLGIGGELGDDNTIEFALTGGTDYRINDRWVANGSVNYLPFADSGEVDFTIGIGYVFGGGR